MWWLTLYGWRCVTCVQCPSISTLHTYTEILLFESWLFWSDNVPSPFSELKKKDQFPSYRTHCATTGYSAFRIRIECAATTEYNQIANLPPMLCVFLYAFIDDAYGDCPSHNWAFDHTNSVDSWGVETHWFTRTYCTCESRTSERSADFFSSSLFWVVILHPIILHLLVHAQAHI